MEISSDLRGEGEGRGGEEEEDGSGEGTVVKTAESEAVTVKSVKNNGALEAPTSL